MSLSIVGSVAFDTLYTREGDREKILGGSAVYSAIAASKFTNSSIIGVVGDDFHEEKINLLRTKNIDLKDLQIKKGKTFHWIGSYKDNINVAQTIDTEIGVLGTFEPSLNKTNASSTILFLANNDPDSHLQAISQSKNKHVAMDTMNLWINIKKEQVEKVMKLSSIVFINDTELKMLTGEYNLIKAAKALMKKANNIEYLILKKGEYGAALFGKQEHEYFTIGAYPLETVKDPTGAGDSFAGSFLGFMADKEMNWSNLKEALLVGTVTASFTVEEFGPDSLINATLEEINNRKQKLIKFLSL